MTWRLRISSDLYHAARARAGSDKALAAYMVARFEDYISAQTTGAEGGRTAAANMTPEARRARSAAGVRARQLARETPAARDTIAD